jgi:hypothetical protein
MPTTIRLVYDGIPIDWDAATDPDIGALIRAVKAARLMGCQGQPIRTGGGGNWGGKPGGRPKPPQPTIDDKGRLCCPHDGRPLKQKEALGGKWACDARNPGHEHVNERGYCRYIIAPEEVTVMPEVKPAPAAMTVEEAFWAWLDKVLGKSADYNDIDRVLGKKAGVPETDQEWRDLGKAVQAALKSKAA